MVQDHTLPIIPQGVVCTLTKVRQIRSIDMGGSRRILGALLKLNLAIWLLKTQTLKMGREELVSKFKFMLRASLWALCLSCCALRGDISIIGDLLEQFDSLPGGTYNGTFTIRNIGEKDENVNVTVTDYTYKADGTSYFHESTPNPAHPRSNSTWISLDTQKALIPPGEERVVRYTVQVPQGESVKGTFWSVLLVEPEIEIQETDQGVTLTPIFRYAVQVMNHLKEGAQANLKPGKDEVHVEQIKTHVEKFDPAQSPDAHKITYSIDVENDGELGLNPEISIQILDKDGKMVFEGKRPKSWLLPDCSVRANFNLSTLPSGKYSSIILMDAGGENFYGVNRELTIP